MFVATTEVALFDYFRVPYERDANARVTPIAGVAGLEWYANRDDAGGARCYWLRAGARGEERGAYHLGTIQVFGRVAPDAAVAPVLDAGGWQRDTDLVDRDGSRQASVWRHPDGSVFLPFDPADLVETVLSEAYHSVGRAGLLSRVTGVARRAYYAVRPVLPRPLQVRVRQLFTRLQKRASFPAWPVEPALHDFYDLLLGYAAEVAGTDVPYLSVWPHGHAWAFVLTHDVETSVGYDNIGLLRTLEERHGYRSSWNFVPRRYDIADAVVRDLQVGGFEVGVHGLYHDGKDFANERVFARRLVEVHEYAKRWGAIGFRSPALHRVWEWMPQLQFAYDSSYPDTDPYEPIAGGSCSVLPYRIGHLVELPVTLPQDFVLFNLLEQPDEAMWLDKARHVRERGGMALLIAHPDYMLDPAPRAAYERLLVAFRDDPTVWKALPRDVADWWMRRDASRLEPRNGHWEVVGPAATDGAVSFVAHDPQRPHAPYR